MTTSKPTKVRVTTVTTYTVDAGEIPDGVVLALIEDGANKFPQSISIGDTDWFLGDGADFGQAQTDSVEAELVK